MPLSENTFGKRYIAFAINSFHSRFSKSPFSKGGLFKQCLVVPPPFLKGGRGDLKTARNGKNFWQSLYLL
jgi:hypothetical protein